MKLRHVGIVVKDFGQIEIWEHMGYKVIERDIIEVVKLMNDETGNVIELVKGKWNPHIAVNFFEDEDKNLLEVVSKTNEFGGTKKLWLGGSY